MERPQFYVGCVCVFADGCNPCDFFIEEGQGFFALFEKLGELREALRYQEAAPELFTMVKELQDRHVLKTMGEFERKKRLGYFKDLTTVHETHFKVIHPMLKAATEMPTVMLKEYYKRHGIRPRKGSSSRHRNPTEEVKDVPDQLLPTRFFKVEDFYGCAKERFGLFSVPNFVNAVLEGEIFYEMYPEPIGGGGCGDKRAEEDFLDSQLKAILEE